MFKEKSFCITGEFLTPQKDGEKPLTRNMVSKMIEAKGGIIKKSVIKSLDTLKSPELNRQKVEFRTDERGIRDYLN